MHDNNLNLRILPNRRELGSAAGAAIASAMRACLTSQGFVRMIFGSAPSQDETIAALAEAPGLDWSRVTIFHLDEYVGTGAREPHSFRRYLQEHLLSRVQPAAFHGIHGEAADSQAECKRYAELLDRNPTDIALLGIGENGHLAFNDPPVDFNDPAAVKVVELAESCRMQQMNDDIFGAVADVPRFAITLTIPALMRAPAIFVMVPGPTKAAAVRCALEGEISRNCPASILRTHGRVAVFLDLESSSQLVDIPAAVRVERGGAARDRI